MSLIETTCHSWRHHATINQWTALLWARSTWNAAKHFRHRLLIADDEGKRLLIDKLGLPFTEVLTLPPGPDGCDRCYGVGKLQAHHIMAERGQPYLHCDHDGGLEKGLSPDMHDTPIIAENRYGPEFTTTAEDCRRMEDLFRELQSVHAKFSPKRFAALPASALASGIFGGNDLDGIARWADASLRCAFNPANRALLQTHNGYQTSVVIEEAAAEHDLGANARFIYTTGDQADADRTGWYHLAGLKLDRGALVQSALNLQSDFPDAYEQTMLRWRGNR